jgi:hypothetical protein
MEGNRITRDDKAKPMMQPSEQTNDRRRVVEGIVCLILFGLTIPAANWLIGHAGTECVPKGPCLIPVAPGLMAPSGVTMIGIALASMIAPPALVIASTIAFLMSEFADLAVYTPLARRRLVAAVVASSMVGLIVDSIVFLYLAFGSLDFLLGQIVGKAWMVLASIPFVTWLRRRDERIGLAPA